MSFLRRKGDRILTERMADSIKVEADKCISCGLCLEVCPAFVFELVEAKAVPTRPSWCIGCGQCGTVCPTEAIHPKGTERGDPPFSPAVSPERLLRLLRERRSVRRYRDEPLSKSLLERIVDAGRYAPTGRNSQNVNYTVLGSPEEIHTLREMTLRFYEKLLQRIQRRTGAFLLSLVAGRKLVASLRESIPKAELARERMGRGDDPLFYHAPALILVHAESWDTCSAFNCSVALYHCSLVAHTLGIGCCFNGYLVSAVNHNRKIKAWLEIPNEHRCYGAMTLGYQAVTYLRLPDRAPPKVRWR